MHAVQPDPASREGHARTVSALLATMDDLAGLAESPEQQARTLALLAERSPNAVLRLDPAGRVLYANPAAAGLLGGRPVPPAWAERVREACAFGMPRSEEMELGGSFHEVTFAPVPEHGYAQVYAVEISRRRQAEEAAREAGRKLRLSLEQGIAMLARAVEKRDPATHAHQLRVAQIAVAIARELGLEPDRIEGLRLGATIHDIGKLHTPAELLARPGRLMALELERIRQHPLAGYDIVHEVDFPWPVAQMVLQHHERMDGTGYPQGLKGQEILLEARILAVADVVDGLSSHRPCRPALGLQAALQEIERMRGRWLDAQAVDACLALFRERGTSLPA